MSRMSEAIARKKMANRFYSETFSKRISKKKKRLKRLLMSLSVKPSFKAL